MNNMNTQFGETPSPHGTLDVAGTRLQANPIGEYVQVRDQCKYGFALCAKAAEPVPYNSAFERDILRLLDWDTDVLSIRRLTRPVAATSTVTGEAVSIQSGYWVRRRSGALALVACLRRSRWRRLRPALRDQADLRDALTGLLPIVYVFTPNMLRIDDLCRHRLPNITWLSFFRRYVVNGATVFHTYCLLQTPVTMSIAALASRLTTSDRGAALNLVYSMLYYGLLRADLESAPLSGATIVWAPSLPTPSGSVLNLL